MRRIVPALLAVALAVAALPAAAVSQSPSNTDPPIISFQPPASWSPSDSGLKAFSRAGVTSGAFTDISSPLPYIAIAACRQYDSRSGTALADNTTRAVTLSGAPCGIPASAQAVAVNITVFSITGAGSNGVFKVGNASPPTTAWINYPPTETQRGNAGVVSVAAGAILYVQMNQGAGTLHFTVDVFGYYSSTAANTNNHFTINATAAGWGAVTGSNTTAAAMSAGVLGLLTGNTTLTSAGTIGYNSGAGTGVWGWSQTTGRGVFGQSGGGPGVWGESTAGTGEGVHGKSAGGVGVFGETAMGGVAAVLGVNNVATNASQGVGGYAGGAAKVFGVQGEIGADATAGSAGVHGIGAATPGVSYGVLGESASASLDAAGVIGRTDTPLNNTNTFWAIAGVRGESGGTFLRVGVLGVSNSLGVVGGHHDGSGVGDAQGFLGYNPGTAYGVYAYSGTIGCNGCVKLFVDPHPTDPSKTIHYVSLEGPEAGTYFRGTARTQNGRAVIEVPDHFRSVTDEEGMTVQLTAVGAPASLYVESQDLNWIVVRTSSDVTFHYLVQGIRPAYRNFQPVVEGREYAPVEPGSRIPEGWTEWAKKRLIENGTYNADGTVNMRTAERMGWAQQWRDEALLREQQAKQAVSQAPQAPGAAPQQ